MKKFVTLFVLVLATSVAFGQVADLFFSEYIEGSSNNKALEIYNGTGAEVDLANYIIRGNYNGNAWSEVFTFSPGAKIANGDVYVIANNQAGAEILGVADTVYAYGAPYYIVSFNGDDVRALCKISGADTTIIDIIGLYNLVDPGDGWDVAGVTNATKDHTLIRKASVTSGNSDWTASAGTNADDSEWIVLDKDTFNYLGLPLEQCFAAITFRANTSVVQGLTDTTGGVDLRGTVTQWGPGTNLTNVGGDYWEITIQLAPGDYEYKYGAQVVNPVDGSVTDYWENDIPGAGPVPNRTLTVGSVDMVLDLDFVGIAQGSPHPYFTPSDSIDVFFRVNMAADQGFDPNKILSFVGGGNNASGEYISFWSPGEYALTQEGTSDYWNFHLKLDPAGVPYDSMMYRFHNNGTEWGGHSEGVFGHGMFPDNENRGISIHGDTTVAWKWWNDQPLAGFEGADTTAITFTTNMSKAVGNNGFTIGDTLLVKLGYFGSSSELLTDTLTRQGFTFNYATTVEQVPVTFGQRLYYQYYLYKCGQEQREVYFNFDYDGNVPSEAERRFFVINTTIVAINDIEDSEVDARRMPVFRNNTKLSRDVTLTLECDIRPAIYQVLAGSTLEDIQSSVTITPAMLAADPDTILKLGVWVNGPMSNNGEGTWQTWGGTLAGDVNRKMYDDGTHGDAVAGDSIFTIVYNMSPDSSSGTVGQEFKFGIGGGDNESGYGLNHIENIDDSQDATTLHVQFGSINPNFYNAWDFDGQQPVGIEKDNAVIVAKFALEQNFPNPFNPTTEIRFSIQRSDNVTLAVYNMLGQMVTKAVYSNLQVGQYTYMWNGTDMHGNSVASGVYFYELQVGNQFRDMKKMVLLK